MATSSHLLLLMMSSSLLLCSQATGPPNQHHLQKRVDKKDVVDAAKHILNAAEPLIDLIDISGVPVGKMLNSLIKLATGDSGDAEKIIASVKAEFKKLGEKLDNNLVVATWNTWASGPYQEVETNIRLAWENLNYVLDSCKWLCIKDEKKSFKDLYTSMEFAPDKLHLLLTTQQPSFIIDFGKLLRDHTRCHEDSIIDFRILITDLMYMGHIINQFYYTLHGIQKEKKTDEMVYETSFVMMQIHKNCILHPDEYIKKDVLDLIDENQDRQKLAEDIKRFLAKVYPRYDWMVVAFITRNSKYSKWYNRFLNRHYLSGFTELTKGEVSVAVAKQVRGTYGEAKKVMEVIKNCFSKDVPKCNEVKSALVQCKGVTNATLTAVHAYVDKSHDSSDTDEDFEVLDSSPTDYIFVGQCKTYKVFTGGFFRVLIKSDEEMKNDDPCKNMKCGGTLRGTCVPLKNVLKAFCECKMGYYGKNCESSLNETDGKAGTVPRKH